MIGPIASLYGTVGTTLYALRFDQMQKWPLFSRKIRSPHVDFHLSTP